MAAREKHTPEIKFVIYEGDRERLGANYIDRSDDLLRTEDRFSDDERQAARDPWLRQGPEHSLKARRRAERIAHEQRANERGVASIDLAAPLTEDLIEQFVAIINLTRRVYDRISDATRSMEAEAHTSRYMNTYAREISSSNTAFSDRNMVATFDLSTRLIRARDLHEALVIQNEFAKTQAENVIFHARHLLELNKKFFKQNNSVSSGGIDQIEAFQAIVDEAESEMKPT